MTDTVERISFDEFSDNLVHIFDRVVDQDEEVIIETQGGDLVLLRPVARIGPGRRTKSKEDYEAFLASAGGWKDVDVDSFLVDNYESRNISSRPPVEL